MHFLSVLVQNEDKRSNTLTGSSGIMLNEKFVIITGNVILKNIVAKYPELFTKYKSGKFHKLDDQCDLNLKVIWKKSPSLFNVFPATIMVFFICENIKHSNREIFRDWAIDTIENNGGVNDQLSVFVVLKIEEQSHLEELRNLLHVWYEGIAAERVERGKDLLCRSTPFGNRFFLDTYSSGIVSNVVGNNSCMILSDCPTAPGSEGAPTYIFKGNEKFPVGMVILSVGWWKGEWVGMTVVADFRPLFAQLVEMPVKYLENGFDMIQEEPCPEVLVPANYTVVQVYAGNGWGTAILLSKEKGIFITNAHVVEDTSNIKFFWRHLSAKGRLIYKTPEDHVYDLAVLECNPQEELLKYLIPCKLYNNVDSNYTFGDVAYCVGHALLPRAAGAPATVTRGRAAPADAHLLRATCAAHPGASGGGLFDGRGRLLGVLVCNAAVAGGAAYPRLAVAVPAAAVADELRAFVRTGGAYNPPNSRTC